MAQNQRLKNIIKFQKTLSQFAGASNADEKKAAELAARRVMTACDIDPVTVPDRAITSHMNFKDNAVLKKLREEWREAHPDYYYKTDSYGSVRRRKTKPRTKPVNTKPVNRFDGMFDDFDFAASVNTKPKATPPDAVNTKAKPHSDRNRDRHSPGYMAAYMRRRRARQP